MATPSTQNDKGRARAELARRLMQLAPKARLDALIEGADARALVRSAPPQDLYMAMIDVGLADAADIVQLSSPNQFRTYLDLAAWSREGCDPAQVLTWLRAARGDDDEEFMAKVHGLDLELLEITLRAYTVIHDLEENPDANPQGVTIESPEGKYLIELTNEGVDASVIHALIRDLIAENPFETSRLFEAIRWELPTELEEVALQFRSARLADLGFPELYEALAIFTYVNPAPLAPPPSTLAGPTIEQAKGHVDYVDSAFRGLTDEERTALADEVRYLVNSALIAEGAEPGDPPALRRVSEASRDYLTLGLEHLCGGDAARAADLVREHHLKRIFQIGFSLTLQLKHRLDRLAAGGLSKLDDTWLLLPDVEVWANALGRRRPLRPLKVEGAEPVPFRSRRELAEASAVVDRIERQLAVFRALLGGEVAGVKEQVARFEVPFKQLTPLRLFSAVVATAVLDGSVVVGPVPEGRLVELCERLFEGEAKAPLVRAGAVERAVATLAARVPADLQGELRSMVDFTLTQLSAELAAPYLTEGRLDPKLVAGLPIAGQKVL